MSVTQTVDPVSQLAEDAEAMEPVWVARVRPPTVDPVVWHLSGWYERDRMVARHLKSLKLPDEDASVEVEVEAWTHAELLDARRAYEQWLKDRQAGNHYDLDERVRVINNAYRRTKARGTRRSQAGAPPPKLTPSIHARAVEAERHAAAGLTRAEAAAEMGISVKYLQRVLCLAGRRDLLAALTLPARSEPTGSWSRRMAEAETYATAGYDLTGAAMQMGVPRKSLDRSLRRVRGGMPVLRRLQANGDRAYAPVSGRPGSGR